MALEKYADIDMNFRRNPLNGDIIRLTTEQSISQSVRNLVLIHFYEKHFNPEIGNFAPGALFENLDDTNILRSVRNSIERILRQYEPRIEVREIFISNDNDVDKNRLLVRVEYVIKGRIGDASTEFYLRRVR